MTALDDWPGLHAPLAPGPTGRQWSHYVWWTLDDIPVCRKAERPSWLSTWRTLAARNVGPFIWPKSLRLQPEEPQTLENPAAIATRCPWTRRRWFRKGWILTVLTKVKADTSIANWPTVPSKPVYWVPPPREVEPQAFKVITHQHILSLPGPKATQCMKIIVENGALLSRSPPGACASCASGGWPVCRSRHRTLDRQPTLPRRSAPSPRWSLEQALMYPITVLALLHLDVLGSPAV